MKEYYEEDDLYFLKPFFIPKHTLYGQSPLSAGIIKKIKNSCLFFKIFSALRNLEHVRAADLNAFDINAI